MLDNIDISKVCCFTGHRPSKLPWGYDESNPKCEEIKKTLKKECEKLIEKGVAHFVTGMALGFDMICADVILDLKKKYPFIKLYGAIPCSDQCSRWHAESQYRYELILKSLEDFRCVFVKYTPYCMQERNQFMVDHSMYVITYYDGSKGGTQNTIKYAIHKQRRIINIKVEE